MFGSLPKVELLGHSTKHLQAKVLQLRHPLIILQKRFFDIEVEPAVRRSHRHARSLRRRPSTHTQTGVTGCIVGKSEVEPTSLQQIAVQHTDFMHTARRTFRSAKPTDSLHRALDTYSGGSARKSRNQFYLRSQHHRASNLGKTARTRRRLTSCWQRGVGKIEEMGGRVWRIRFYPLPSIAEVDQCVN